MVLRNFTATPSTVAGMYRQFLAAASTSPLYTTFTGTVTKVEWTNPHVHFFLDVKDPSGTAAQWEFTMGAVNGLFRRGWTKELLKPGDTITVDGYLARDGSHLANARVVTLRDGRKMSGGTMVDEPAN